MQQLLKYSLCALSFVLCITACNNTTEPKPKEETNEATTEASVAEKASETPTTSKSHTIERDPMIERAKAHAEVMRIHDEVMPRMTDLTRIKQTLFGAMEAANSEKNTELAKELDKRIKDISQVEKGMFDWMRAYKEPSNNTYDEAMAYLKDENEKVTKVKEDIMSAIESGNAYIEELKKIGTE